MAELTVNIMNCQHAVVCEICLQCKALKDPFSKESIKKTKGLDLVYTDLCGTLQLPPPKGNRYILTLIDDYIFTYCNKNQMYQIK